MTRDGRTSAVFRLPASPGQQRLAFLDRVEGGSPAFNLASAVRIEGPLDPGVLEDCFRQLIARHETLRTAFDWTAEGVEQLVHEDAPFAMERNDFSGAAAESRETLAAGWICQCARGAFALKSAPLFRGLCARLASNDHVIGIIAHHIISDGVSMGIAFDELAALYLARSRGHGARLPELPIQYADFAAWQIEQMERPEMQAGLAFWKSALAGAAALELPLDAPRPAIHTIEGATEPVVLPKKLADELRALGRSCGATTFVTLAAVFASVLARYTGQPEVLIGTAVDGRDRPECHNLIGLFLNTIALRIAAPPALRFVTVVENTRDAAFSAYSRAPVPFQQVVEAVQPERDASRTPLFQVMLILQKAQPAPLLGPLRLSPVPVHNRTSQYDLTLSLVEGEDIRGYFEYNTRIFHASTIQRLARHVVKFAEEAVRDAERPAGHIPLFGAEERDALLEAGQPIDSSFEGTFAHEAVIAQAERRSGRVAVICGSSQITYGELARRSLETAWALAKMGAGPERTVAVEMERSTGLVIALLAVLRCGAAWLPLDPSLPEERRRNIIEAARPAVILRSLPEKAGRRAALARPTSANTAYLMFTSGSTGKPKGVAVEHRSLSNLLESFRESTGFSGRDTLLSVTTISFDISLLELLLPLVCGGRLAIAERSAVSDGAALEKLIARRRPALMQATPSTWRLLEQAGWEGAAGMRILCGGELLDSGLAEYLLPRCAALWNVYGPTETTIWSTARRVSSAAEAPLIGGSLPNTRLYVLNAQLEAVPYGATGEIFIAGAGVARGYCGLPGETAGRFLPDPFAGFPGARMYRTGDRGRRLENGLIEFRGRADRQMKVRGYRVEPGDIEAVLSAHPGVAQAVVKFAAGERIAAYVVSKNGPLDMESLRAHAGRHLPEYMAPSAIVEMPRFPSTPSGKVDFNALLDPVVPVSAATPRSGYEEITQTIWAKALGLPSVGREDHFFHLGGHSVMAAQVASLVRQIFGTDPGIRALFEAPVLHNYARRIEQQKRPAAEWLTSPIPRQPLASGPLSPAQRRMWFLDRLHDGSAIFNIPGAVRLRGPLQLPALRESWKLLLRRHDIWRTAYAEADGEPFAKTVPDGAPPPAVADLSMLDADQRERAARWAVSQCASRAFEVASGDVIRAIVVRLAADDHVFALAVHHIAADGWSLEILAQELAALYAAQCGGLPAALPELAYRYADYAAWCSGLLAGGALSSQREYWKRQLQDPPPPLFPSGRRKRTFSGRTADLPLRESSIRGLAALARNETATLFMVMLAALQAFFFRLTGHTDIAIGSPIARRIRPEFEGVAGCFINTLVLRGDVRGEPTFRELVRRARALTLDAYENQDLPFEEIVASLNPRRSAAAPLFQAVLIVQNYPFQALELAGMQVEPYAAETGTAHFDLTVMVVESQKGLWATLEYDTGILSPEEAGAMARSFGAMLDAIAGDPDQRVPEYALTDARGCEELILLGRTESFSALPEEPLAHGIAARAQRHPDRAAVEQNGRSLTYAQLEGAANALAQRLADAGAEPEKRAGIYLDRSPDWLIAMLAVMKSGAAYVPLDPGYPVAHLRKLIRASGIGIIVANRSAAEELGVEIPVVGIDADASAANPVEIRALPRSLAYVLFTSGSTGEPKCTGVEHRSLARFAAAARAAFGITENDRVLQFASLSWDTSAEEIFPCLLAGGTLVLRGAGRVEGCRDFLESCRRGRITVVDLPTSYWHELTREMELAPVEWPPCLRLVIIGGERAAPDRIAAWHRVAPAHVRIFDSYGATEATAITALEELRPGRESALGRPLPGVQVYVLDSRFGPVPAGFAGELFAGGPNIARGYLNEAAATAAAFLPDPFSAEPGARMYRTGDIARWRPDGRLQLVGREDLQLKVRGHRLEPGEVEAALRGHPAVRDAIVLEREQAEGLRELAAFAAVGSSAVAPQELRAFLAERLPPFAVPAVVTPLPEFPRLAAGKIDRRALLEIEIPSAPASLSMPAPLSTPVQFELAKIWNELLPLAATSLDDDFFALGGHSLLAVRLAARVSQAFETQLPLRALFEQSTLGAMAREIARLRAAPEPDEDSMPSALPAARAPLSFAQERLWFLAKLTPGSAAYNMPVAFYFPGEIDVAALRRSFDELARRHPSLRTSFASENGVAVQRIEAPRPAPFAVIDLDALAPETRTNEAWRIAGERARAPFDLAVAPLLRIVAFRLSADEHAILAILHHIVCDAWSFGILARELDILYRGFAAGLRPALPEPAVEYAQFAVHQREGLRGSRLEELAGFWRRELEGVPPLELPLDFRRPPIQTFEGGAVPIALSASLALALRELGRGEGATLFMTLLAAFEILLAGHSGQRDFAVGSPVSGRSRPELENVVGFFVNTIALRARVDTGCSFREMLRGVRRTCLEAFAHQELPFETLVEILHPERDGSRNPVFQAGFGLNTISSPAVEMFGRPLLPVAVDSGASKFDLSLGMVETAAGLSGALEFNSSLFRAETMERLLERFQALLGALVRNPAAPIREIDFSTGRDREDALRWSRGPVRSVPPNCLHEAVEAAAERHPAAEAVRFEGASLSYRQMNACANAIARKLLDAGVQAETTVAVLMHRCLELPSVLLGVLKAGAAYVPLDPDGPPERLRRIIAESGAKIAIARPPHADAAALRVCSPDIAPSQWTAENPNLAVDPEQLCCILYTSGSTGVPKGVMSTHRAIQNRLAWMQAAFELDRSDRVLQKTPLTFDVSIWEFFWPLLNGACVVLASPGAHRDPARMAGVIAAEKISTVHFVPSMLAAFLRETGLGGCGSLRRAMAGGEALPPELARDFHRRLPCPLYNLYGPTEAAIDVTWHECSHAQPAAVPIGVPISNVSVYVVLPNGALAPAGVAGEICIGGIAPARGYCARPDLTAAAFTPDPFSGEAGARMYRTGDRGRYLPDGAIEFLGRTDHEIKLRGNRIQPAEIRSALLEHAGIQDAAVVAQPLESGLTLVAYLVAAGARPGDAELRSHLRERLPDYMLPSRYAWLDRLPLSPHGKLDPAALPAVLAPAQVSFVAPRDPVELEIAQLWSKLLGVEKIGIYDDFFKLGGHSLLLVQLAAEIRERFLIEMPLALLFDSPQLGDMVEAIALQQLAESAPETAAEAFAAARGSVEAGGPR